MGRSIFIQLLAVLGLSLDFAIGKDTQAVVNHWWDRGIPVQSYDCTGKPDGNYPNPEDCGSYIACVGGTDAYIIACDPGQGDIILHFAPTSGPDPLTSRCMPPPEANCTLNPPTQLLGECKHMECREVGDCTHYEICSDGAWKNETCGEDLYWNPEIENGFGGACDYFASLSATIKYKYTSNPFCIPPCKWWQETTDVCSGIYHFLQPFNVSDPLSVEQRKKTFKCPNAPAGSFQPNLIWNPDKLACDQPSNVAGCNGT